MNHSPQGILLNGLTGLSASSIAFIATLIQDVEAWVRFGTVIISLLIAIVTVINAFITLKKSLNELKKK